MRDALVTHREGDGGFVEFSPRLREVSRSFSFVGIDSSWSPPNARNLTPFEVPFRSRRSMSKTANVGTRPITQKPDSPIGERTETLPMKLTAVYIEVPDGYIAFVEELPGANTQGDTLEEARENLQEAVAMVLEANRELAEKSIVGRKATKEPFVLSAS